MAIKVKAIERNVSFTKGEEKWAYVLQADLYSKLSADKVIQEAALRSGISRGSINAAWDAIGEVIKAWPPRATAWPCRDWAAALPASSKPPHSSHATDRGNREGDFRPPLEWSEIIGQPYLPGIVAALGLHHVRHILQTGHVAGLSAGDVIVGAQL